jgi:hypothetical protein
MNSGYQWQNGVDGENSDENNNGLESWQSGQSSMIEYSEHGYDGETQFSEDSAANNNNNSSMEFNESYDASENTQIKSSTNSAFAHSDMMRYNLGVHEYHEGVASRKDNETKSNTSRRVALDFQDSEPNENQSTRHRPPSKGPPLKKQLLTQRQASQSYVEKETAQGQPSQSSVEQIITQGQTSQPITRQGNTQAQNTKQSKNQVHTQGQASKSYAEKETAQGQPSQSSVEQIITQGQTSQPITRQASKRSTNPFGSKWIQQTQEDKD